MYDGLEALYGGAASGGKTDALLMGALQYVDVPSYAALLLRRSYTDLSLPGALMDRSHEWLKGRTDARWDRETHTWHFPSGASLTFGYIGKTQDRFRYQSSEFQYIGWDEITEFPDEDAYLFLFSRLRKLHGVEVPLRVRCASNPVGLGAYWVRKRFIDLVPPPEDLEGNPDPHQRIFIPAGYYDNPHIDADSYLVSLSQLPESTQKRLIEGSWDEIEDAAFSEFDHDIHVVDPFFVPRDWRRWEAMDFGTTNPTAWLAAAMAPRPGEDPDTIVHGEYYSPGLVSNHASAILTNRDFSWGQPSIAFCDPSIQARTGFGESGRGETIHSEFAKHGINLVPANNDRRAGRVRISQLLRRDPSRLFPEWHHRAGELGAPRLFFTRDCRETVEQVKFAPLDSVEGETVDGYWETRKGHALAALRYLVTARIYPNPTARAERDGDRSLAAGTWREWNQWREA